VRFILREKEAPVQDHYRKLERLYAKAPINRYFEPQLQVEEGRATLTMAVKPDFFHAAGAAHGAVYFKALDDATFFAAQSLVADVFVLTVTFNIYFLKPISHGEMKAVGRVVHASRRLLVAEGELFDADGRVIGRGSGTFMPSRIPLGEELGYR
jgi:uncharacterized domain 1